MSGLGESTLLLTVMSALSTLVTLGFEIALLVAVLTVVRRHRPDAVALLAAGPGINICATIFTAIAYPLGSRLMVSSSGGYESMTIFYAAMHVGSTLVFSASALCWLLGLIRLAKPPKDDHGGLMPARF